MSPSEPSILSSTNLIYISKPKEMRDPYRDILLSFERAHITPPRFYYYIDQEAKSYKGRIPVAVVADFGGRGEAECLAQQLDPGVKNLMMEVIGEFNVRPVTLDQLHASFHHARETEDIFYSATQPIKDSQKSAYNRARHRAITFRYRHNKSLLAIDNATDYNTTSIRLDDTCKGLEERVGALEASVASAVSRNAYLLSEIEKGMQQHGIRPGDYNFSDPIIYKTKKKIGGL